MRRWLVLSLGLGIAAVAGYALLTRAPAPSAHPAARSVGAHPAPDVHDDHTVPLDEIGDDSRARLEEILGVRARQGEIQHKTDIIRDAINLYLSHQDDIPGTRAAITRKLEGRMDAVETQLQRQNDLLEKVVAFLRKKRGG